MNDRAAQPSLLQLRTGNQGDLDSVMEVMNSAFDPMFGEAWTRSQCAGILPMSGVVLTVAESSAGKPIGFSLHRAIAGEAELLLLAVTRTEQRKGVGTGLLKGFLADAGKRGVSRVHLEVRENNPALAMYRAAGFQAVGRRPDYYAGKDGSRFDALTFAKDLVS